MKRLNKVFLFVGLFTAITYGCEKEFVQPELETTNVELMDTLAPAYSTLPHQSTPDIADPCVELHRQLVDAAGQVTPFGYYPAGNATLLGNATTLEVKIDMAPYWWITSIDIRHAAMRSGLCNATMTTEVYAPPVSSAQIFLPRFLWSTNVLEVRIHVLKRGLTGNIVWAGVLFAYNTTDPLNCVHNFFEANFAGCNFAMTEDQGGNGQ